MKRAVGWAVVLIAAVAMGRAAPESLPNHVVNGGFEQGTMGWAYLLAAAQGTGQVDRAEKHSGTASFRMTHASKFAPNVYSRLTQGVGGLRPETAYRVTTWCNGKDVGIAWIGGGPGWFFRTPLPKGTYGWRKVNGYYLTGKGETGFDLMVICESPTKALWVDDIEMVEAPEKTRAMHAEKDANARAVAGKLRTAPAEEKSREARLEEEARARGMASDGYVQLGLSVVRRFIERVATRGPKHDQGDDWSMLQIDEVKTVLDETQKRIESRVKPVEAGRPGAGRAVLRDGVFEVGGRPWFFDGYGHFDSVIHDLPDFPALGASLVQDGRAGPSSMNEDYTLKPTALQVIEGVNRAGANGMRVDFLVSPHYFPDWALKKWPDLPNGNPNWLSYSVDHPGAREVNEKWLTEMAARLRGEHGAKAGLFSYCLSNEPTYEQSGRDRYSAPLWPKWLENRHGSIENLNALYGTQYADFEQVPVPPKGMPQGVAAQRAYYDWVRFNCEHWAGFHAWESSVLHRVTPDVPTHAKIMVFFTFDRDKLHWGVDPELFCGATDLAGCDAYAFPGGQELAYDWFGNEFFYDLLHSFRNQPVFNSENHLIPDNSGPGHIAPEHTRAVLWQGGLHHQGATTIWVWEEAADPSLAGSIYFRPANVWAAGRAMLDLNRLAPEVAAINRAPARFALLYSPSSIFWEEKYRGTIFSLYRVLSLMGEKVTFVSEKQLAEGRAPDAAWIVLPEATHVSDAAVAGLVAFAARGGHLLAVGDGDLAFDEYHRPRTLPAALAQMEVLQPAAEEPATAARLREMLGRDGVAWMDVEDTRTGALPRGVEWREVQTPGGELVPVINLTTARKTVRFGKGFGTRATDLLSGKRVDLRSVKLEPMAPLLLEIDAGRRDASTAANARS